jgi:hypothetical protein
VAAAPAAPPTAEPHRPLIECVAAEDWNLTVPQHHYSLGEIAGSLSLMLDGRGSLRGSALVLAFISRLLGRKPEVPSPTSVRTWLLRVGLYQLQRPLEKADDWVWIVDHTVQIGELKCFLIVGFRLEVWQQQEVRTLTYSEVDLIGLWPVRSSTGEIVAEQPEAAVARTGSPRLIISDEGRDLHRGLALFQERQGSVAWIYDIKHKTASLLKAALQNDPEWTAFATQANVMKRQVYLTELAFSNPPQQRGKARYMSIDRLVAWGCKMLRWLDQPRSIGRELTAHRVAEKLGWLRDYRESLQKWAQAMQVIETVETMVRQEGYHAGSEAEFRQRLPALEPDSLAARLRDALLEFVKQQAMLAADNERLPGSSEVLESIIGKYKSLQGEHGQFGTTSMLLSIGAFVGRLTQSVIRTALTTITTATLGQWEQTHLGSTIQSQRKQAFPTARSGTKTGSNQLALTSTN